MTCIKLVCLNYVMAKQMPSTDKLSALFLSFCILWSPPSPLGFRGGANRVDSNSLTPTFLLVFNTVIRLCLETEFTSRIELHIILLHVKKYFSVSFSNRFGPKKLVSKCAAEGVTFQLYITTKFRLI